MSVAKVGAVVLDCPDPRALAGFYAGLTGGAVEGEGDWVDLRIPGGPTLAFQAAPGYVPPRWPAADHSQQFHLDLTVDDLDAAEKEALALGARPGPRKPGRSARGRPRPAAGHPFCLCAC
jgi:hypothetical protein